MAKKVAVIMGSDSDWGVLKGAVKTLKGFGIETEVRVMSAHRTPEEASSFASGAHQAGFGVIIAAAGKAAHLAGVLAAHTTLPVIGIPIKSSTLGRLDALLSTVQMPKGIPWPPWPSTARRTRHFWLSRSLPFRTKGYKNNWRP